ncbi:hypothetical protein LXL04_037595 [Taraxacum kok-saghyz]
MDNVCNRFLQSSCRLSQTKVLNIEVPHRMKRVRGAGVTANELQISPLQRATGQAKQCRFSSIRSQQPTPRSRFFEKVNGLGILGFSGIYEFSKDPEILVCLHISRNIHHHNLYLEPNVYFKLNYLVNKNKFIG